MFRYPVRVMGTFAWFDVTFCAGCSVRHSTGGTPLFHAFVVPPCTGAAFAAPGYVRRPGACPYATPPAALLFVAPPCTGERLRRPPWLLLRPPVFSAAPSVPLFSVSCGCKTQSQEKTKRRGGKSSPDIGFSSLLFSASILQERSKGWSIPVPKTGTEVPRHPPAF